jgi:flagellar hook-associated protein 1
MSLMTAMNTSVSGLRVTQLGINSVSENVANADSVGYTRRRLYASEQLAGDRGVGVRPAELRRTLDTILQRQLRLESSGANYTSTKNRVHQSLDQLFGPPGGANSLDTSVNRFTQSLRSLATDPASYTNRSNVLNSSNELANRLNSLSQDVQLLRADAEAGIASGVTKVNQLLSELTKVNSQITGKAAYDGPALLDQRDQLINELSSYVDVRVSDGENGSISVFTTGGLQLFDGVASVRLEFDQRTNLSPQSLYNADPTKSGVGVLRAVNGAGGSVDVIASKLFRSGELAAYVELRDQTLVAAQTQLDELAAGLSLALSDRNVPGVAATAGPATGFDVDLTGLQSGNVITLNAVQTPAGTARKFSFVRVDDPTQLPLPNTATADTADQVFGIDFSGGPASVATQIQAALGGGYSVSNPSGSTLRILDDGAGNTTNVTGLSANITVTGLTSGTPELPFFVDGGAGGVPYTGSFDGGSKLVGFAGRIALNPALVADQSRLVVFNTAPTTLSGDSTRPTQLIDKLANTTRAFSPQTGVGGLGTSFNGNVLAFAQRVVETQGSDAEAASRLNEGQQTVLSNIESRYAETAGVNVDEEMSRLIQLQTAYAANARVITAAKDMMDVLLRI